VTLYYVVGWLVGLLVWLGWVGLVGLVWKIGVSVKFCDKILKNSLSNECK
jgi:hypothetical protein